MRPVSTNRRLLFKYTSIDVSGESGAKANSSPAGTNEPLFTCSHNAHKDVAHIRLAFSST
jgi:hypothetical protein